MENLVYDKKESGARIRDLRIKAKMTQEQLSEILHISERQLQRLESGERDLPAKIIVSLVQYFGVTSDFILTGRNLSASSADPVIKEGIQSASTLVSELSELIQTLLDHDQMVV